jgi:peptide/nickel transport system substrate-binding protein
MAKLNRRDFLRLTAMTTVGMVAASCAQPEPTAEPTEAPTEPPAAAATDTPVPATATPEPVEQAGFGEAPMLAEMVEAGELPAVEERLPEDPAVVDVVDEIGEYGGTWRRVAIGVGDIGGAQTRVDSQMLISWGTDASSIVPNIASKWEVSNEGKTYTFFLRPGMKWSDGEPFTADDMMYWYEDIALNEDISPTFTSWLKVQGEPMQMEKIDDYTFSMSFAAPYGLLPQQLAFRSDGLFYPMHYLQQFHADYADEDTLAALVEEAEFERWDQLHGDRANYLVNTELPVIRPWHMTQGPPETIVIFERNPFFWKVDPSGNQLPYIDRQRYTLVEDVEVVNLRAVSGEIDMQMRHMSFSNFPLFKENEEQGDYTVRLWQMGETGITVFPNLTLVNDDVLRDVLRDVRFRTALSLSIDRDEVNELSYNGMANDLKSLVPADLHGEADLWEPYDYDVDRANALLDEMELGERGSDGYRLRPDGEQLSLTIEGLVAFPAVEEVCQLIVGYWQEIGINAAFKPVTYDLWWDRIGTSEYQVAGYLQANLDPIIQTIYARAYAPVATSSYYAPEWGRWYTTDGTAGMEPTGDALEAQQIYDQIKVTVDPDEQIELMKDIYRIWLRNVWTIVTVGRYPAPMIVKNNFHNVPEEGINSWPLKTPNYTHPEQYFMTS